MGEYFELTFFARKGDDSSRRKERQAMLRFFSLQDGHNAVQTHRFHFFEGKDVLLDIVDERNYCAYCVCVSDVHFTRKNEGNIFAQILTIVNACFREFPSVVLATGIYELTFHYIDEKFQHLEDIDPSVLSKFPFVAFRKGDRFGLTPTGECQGVCYAIQKGAGVQVIYSEGER